MRIGRVVLSTALLLSILTALAACNKSVSTEVPNSRLVTSEQRSEMLGLDFSEEISSLDFVSRRESRNTAGRIGLAAADAINIHSDEDERILGARRVNGEQLLCAQDVMSYMSQFLNQHNALPPTGLDLFPELSTQEGYVNFMSMPASQRRLNYYAGINLYTGKFYQSFDGSIYEPGGVVIEPASKDGDKWVDRSGEAIGYVNDDGTPMEFHGFYRFTVLGHLEDEVLYSTHCGYKANCEGPSGSG